MSTSVSTVRERWNKKLSNSGLFERLVKHLQGRLDPPLQPADITGILKLVGKIMPDLQSVEVNNTININDLSRLEMDARLIALGKSPKQVWESIDRPLPALIHEDESTNDNTGTTDRVLDTSAIESESVEIDQEGTTPGDGEPDV